MQKSSIKFIIRVRPDPPQSPSIQFTVNRGSLAFGKLSLPLPVARLFSNDSQQEIFRCLIPQIDGAVEKGSHLTLIASGGQSTGKSFSTIGGEGQESGIIKRLSDLILKYEGDKYVSFLQISNQQLVDLSQPAQKLQIHQNSQGIYIEGLSEHQLATQNFSQHYKFMLRQRKVLKSGKSLSHLVVQFIVEKIVEDNGQKRLFRSKINVVDLASGKSRPYSSLQNKSLSCLSKVINCLWNRQKPNFRQSKLTACLKDVMEKGQIVLLLCVSGLVDNLSQTLFTFKQFINSQSVGFTPVSKLTNLEKKQSGRSVAPRQRNGLTRDQHSQLNKRLLFLDQLQSKIKSKMRREIDQMNSAGRFRQKY